jgi:hypothetical protein
VQRGEVLYHEGRYIEAAEMFELTEDRLAESPPDVRAEYGLYRGLTFLRLDDLRSARQWLSYAYAVEQKTPGELDAAQEALLARGLRELDLRTRAQGVVPPPESPVVASASAPERRGGPGSPVPPVTNGRRSIAPE